MRINSPKTKRLQGAVDASRRARRRTLVLQVSDNKADAVPCERLRLMCVLHQQNLYHSYPLLLIIRSWSGAATVYENDAPEPG